MKPQLLQELTITLPLPSPPLPGFDTLGTIIANANSSGQALLTSAELPHVYHLVKPETGDQGEEGPRQGAKIMSEVFLTRLLSTKVWVMS